MADSPSGSINLPPGYQLEAPAAPTPPPGYTIEGQQSIQPAQSSAPLTEQEAKTDQANPLGSAAANQAHQQLNAPSKDPDHVRFKASDGTIHDVPKEHLTKAVQIDPKLQVIDWPSHPESRFSATQDLGDAVVAQAKDRFGIKPIQPPKFDPKTGASLQEVEDQPIIPDATIAKAAASGVADATVGKAVQGAKSLLGGGKDVAEQGLKDIIKTASGAKDPDVIDTIHGVLDKTKLFSTVENELKLAKPKLEAMKDAANTELENLRNSSTGVVTDAKNMAHTFFDKMIKDSEDVLEADSVKEGIHAVRDFVTPKLENGEMKFKDLNDVKGKIDDEIKKWENKSGQQQVVNTIDKAKQEALHKARDLMRTLEQQAEPASKAVNEKLSNLIETVKVLGKKFENLDTAEKATNSYEATRSAAKKKALGTVGKTVATGLGAAGAYETGKKILETLVP